MYNHKIVDTVSKTETIVSLSDNEIAEIEANQVEIAKEIAAFEQYQAKKEAAKAKLEALGLTPDDLKVLGL